MKQNSTEWFRANGFYGGAMTTIRRKGLRTVHYDQIEGDLAHCSVFDMDNNVLILDEAVINGGTYKLSRYGNYIFLDNQGSSNCLRMFYTSTEYYLARIRTTTKPTTRSAFMSWDDWKRECK